MYPWDDYGGRVSPLKLTVFAALFVPAGWVAFAYGFGLLGARPLNEAIHQIGLWTIRLIFLALAVTPLRQLLQWPRLILVRRMIGVAAFAYVLIHFSLYTASQAFDLDKVASEIVHRVYLTIGFTALLGLAALAATSTDGMVRRLGGRRWQLLHRLVYAIGVLAVIHYCFQSKLDLWQPTIMAGLLFWLFGYRLLLWRLWRARASGAAVGGRAQPRRGGRHRTRRSGLFPARLPRPVAAGIGHRPVADDRGAPGGGRAGDRARADRGGGVSRRGDPAAKAAPRQRPARPPRANAGPLSADSRMYDNVRRLA